MFIPTTRRQSFIKDSSEAVGISINTVNKFHIRLV